MEQTPSSSTICVTNPDYLSPGGDANQIADYGKSGLCPLDQISQINLITTQIIKIVFYLMSLIFNLYE